MSTLHAPMKNDPFKYNIIMWTSSFIIILVCRCPEELSSNNYLYLISAKFSLKNNKFSFCKYFFRARVKSTFLIAIITIAPCAPRVQHLPSSTCSLSVLIRVKRHAACPLTTSWGCRDNAFIRQVVLLRPQRSLILQPYTLPIIHLLIHALQIVLGSWIIHKLQMCLLYFWWMDDLYRHWVLPLRAPVIYCLK